MLRAAALIVTGLLINGCASGLLLYPTRGPLITPAKPKALAFEDGKLEVWTIRTPSALEGRPELFVLSFIGNADRAERWIVDDRESWKEASAEIWTVNYPGYGGSTKPAALDRIPDSSLLAFDELQKEAAGRPIFVSGSSLGTAAALHVAANRPVAGIILRNPPPLRSLILGRYGWWNLWIAAGIVALQVPSELGSLENAPKVKAPAVFVLSKSDEVVPPEYQRDVVDAYGGPKTLVEVPGDHNAWLRPEARESLQTALRRMVADATSRRPGTAERR